MFSGQTITSLVEKSKFSPPQRFEDFLAAGVYVTRGFDHNLMVMTRQAFQELTRQVLSMNLTDPAARMLLRMILGNAAEVTPDAGGQLPLPDRLCQFASLDSRVVLVGMGDFFEIWAPEIWQKQEETLMNPMADASRYASLHLALR